MSEELGQSPPQQHGRVPRLRGFLPLNSDEPNPLATRGQGTLSSLITSRSAASLSSMNRRPSIFRAREPEDEENGTPAEDFRRGDDRRMSAVLFKPQMRSQRLIGNSNPRYDWER